MNHGQQIEVPGYRIERILGKGGMATVYLATQMSLGRPVALKVLHDPDTPQFFERFFNEGRCIARLSHSNLISIFDIGQGDGFYYIAMEYLPGGDLKSRIAQGIKPTHALKILNRLAGCLAYVHGEGVVHRDIKPSNILFGNDGSPILTDFGIAKLIQADNDLTVTGTVMGSPHYLSPELAQGIRRVDGRSDLYSLGIIFYEMLTGRKPYTADSFAATLMAHIQKPLPKLPEQYANLQPLLDKLLAKKPEDRFQSGAELVMNLQPFRSKKRLQPDSLDPDSQVSHTQSIGVASTAPATPYRWLVYPALGGFLLLSWFGFKQITSEPDSTPLLEQTHQTELTKEIAVVAPASSHTLELPAAEIIEPEPPEESTITSSPTTEATSEETPAASDTKNNLTTLLSKAESRLAADKLSYPEGDSARFYFQSVLKQQPNHLEANRGLDKVAQRYADLAQTQITKGRTLRARRYLNQGLDVRPKDRRLIRMMNELNRPKPPKTSTDIFNQLTPEMDR
ncbi:MAG: protein kinase [Sedimenticola sp.]|nr:protein kinase [Sedimenticola sp.]